MHKPNAHKNENESINASVNDAQSSAADDSAAVKSAHKKKSVLQKLSFIWTIVSVAFGVLTAFYNIATQLVPRGYTVALLIFVVVYLAIAAITIGAVAAITRNPKSTKKAIKNVKAMAKITQAAMDVVLLCMNVSTIASTAQIGLADRMWAWSLFSASLVVSVLSLVTKIAILIIKLTLPRLLRRGTYSVYEVVDGKIKENNPVNGLLKKLHDSAEKSHNEERQLKAENEEKARLKREEKQFNRAQKRIAARDKGTQSKTDLSDRRAEEIPIDKNANTDAAENPQETTNNEGDKQ